MLYTTRTETSGNQNMFWASGTNMAYIVASIAIFVLLENNANSREL